ncbi:MICOS complex subunit MIC19 [Arapaima gigas]
MGSNSSSRRVSFEADEDDNVTVVKGIRLSENLLNRMRGTSPPEFPQPASFVPVPVTPSSIEPLVHLPTEYTGLCFLLCCVGADEIELRKKIAEELQTGLEQERHKTELQLHERLEEENTKIQAQIQEEVKRILEAEQTAAQENFKQGLLKERVTAEHELLQAQFYAQQLEERDQELRKREAFYVDQLGKLEERNTEFDRVTMENYHKTAEVISSRFKRYEYLQCVNNVKQTKMRIGG